MSVAHHLGRSGNDVCEWLRVLPTDAVDGDTTRRLYLASTRPRRPSNDPNPNEGHRLVKPRLSLPMSGKVPEEKGKADESSTVRSECESYSPRSDDEEVRSNRMAGDDGDPVTISGVAQTSVPVVNVERMTGLDDADELLIKIVTYRTHSPLSTIFELLENERLDVLHSNTFFSGDKVFHHIQVKVLMPSRLQPGVLRQRLFALASS